MIFILPSGAYDEDFIKGLAMASHLKLVTPTDLDLWFNKEQLSHRQIALRCLKLVKANVKRN